MPRLKKVWASWNYIRDGTGKDHDQDIVLTYWMNRLQPFIPKNFPLFVTLNPKEKPEPSKLFKTVVYEHPIYIPKGVAAQVELQKSKNSRGLHFIGAYCGYGFHEDGLVAGLRAAESLGAKCPWTLDNSRYVTANYKLPSAVGLDLFVMLVCFFIFVLALIYTF